jgi:PRC-barrel domain
MFFVGHGSMKAGERCTGRVGIIGGNAMAEATMTRTGKPLIESDRVEGTTVYDPRGNNIGSIERLMIDKVSGRVAYAVMSFGGFLGIGEEEHAVPWSKLTYDPDLGGYRTDITEDQLKGAPAFSRDAGYDWSDRKREQELHDHYRTPYYWGL